ncbi:MAG: AI-2E family transporter [Ktedonobacterales bacterium]
MLANQRGGRRRDIVITILGVLVIVAVLVWATAHVAHALLVVLVAALLAYALFPAVNMLARYVPRWVAILVVYLAVVSAFGAIGYLVITAAIDQITALTHQITLLLSPTANATNSPLLGRLRSLGVTQEQINAVGDQVLAQAQMVLNSAVPVLEGVFNAVLDIILVTVLSIYLLIDGHRAIQLARTGVPIKHRARVTFTLTTLERVVGGYIRGQLVLATLVGLLVGLGMMVLRVPYAVLLGVLAFVLEFIPILGVFISGAACVLIALTQSWFLAVLVLVYFIVVHIIEGDIVGPRIVGRAVGVHPAVSIFALLAGAELFGLWGALFASPLAGLLQTFLSEVWREWREYHAAQYPEEFGAPLVPVTTRQPPTDTKPPSGVSQTASTAPPSSQETLLQPRRFAVRDRTAGTPDLYLDDPGDSAATQAATPHYPDPVPRT